MTLVVDASTVVAALSDAGPDGRWAASVLAERELVAPHLLPFEAANILRRAELAGDLSRDAAALAAADLLRLRIELWSFEPLAARCWELRANLTSYDAAYVALAELLDAPFATLDHWVARAPGPRCRVLTPPVG